MNILGISGGIKIGNQDGAAALVIDGELVAAAEEERFLGIKFANGQLPRQAIAFCLGRAGLDVRDLDAVVFAGATYERFDHNVGPDIPAQPGTNLYAMTKSLGHEICRVFTQHHDLYVIGLFFYHFHHPDEGSELGRDLTPFSVTWEDTGRAFASALSVDLKTLPSRWESFFVFADLPHHKFSNEKTKRLLGWQPTNDLHEFWTKTR